ncbi:MAG: hypothetical protein IT223_12475 [Crocinitomicaceae bacterium]|nr:hypothetical protein [Crocinitomicaceae bacterium]
MKLKINILLLTVGLIIIAGIFSCKKGDQELTETQQSPKGTLMFHLHSYLDMNEVDLYNIVYTTSSGRDISLSLAQMYISDIQLVKADGSTYSVSGKNVLKVFESETFEVGEVPVGNYKSVRFKVGLNPATNAVNPESSPDVAILNRPEMWFGTNAQPDGYVFLNVQGSIDTTALMTGTPVPFVYKIGTNANYVQVTLPDNNFSIMEDQVQFVHLLADYYKLFEGIQLDQINHLFVESPADNSSVTALTIAANIPKIFRYDE